MRGKEEPVLPCFFATDLHGSKDRFDKLFACVRNEHPAALFLGGDILPLAHWGQGDTSGFIEDFFVASFRRLRESLGNDYPRVFLILGNDDPRCSEDLFDIADGGWEYIHAKRTTLADFSVYGYACVPPTPFLLKDWERYDVSRYVAPGCVSPEEGHRSVKVEAHEVKWGTIKQDLNELTEDDNLDRAIFLFHTPPGETVLDYAALAGRTYEYVALDPHVGSLAVRRFIENRQPLLTLHGHVHESTRMTGDWKTQIGRTVCINGAHDGPELALVRFDPASPADATRELI